MRERATTGTLVLLSVSILAIALPGRALASRNRSVSLPIHKAARQARFVLLLKVERPSFVKARLRRPVALAFQLFRARIVKIIKHDTASIYQPRKHYLLRSWPAGRKRHLDTRKLKKGQPIWVSDCRELRVKVDIAHRRGTGKSPRGYYRYRLEGEETLRARLKKQRKVYLLASSYDADLGAFCGSAGFGLVSTKNRGRLNDAKK